MTSSRSTLVRPSAGRASRLSRSATVTCDATDVILRDGVDAPAAAARRGRRRGVGRLLRAASRSTAATCASTASRPSTRSSSRPSSSRTGRSGRARRLGSPRRQERVVALASYVRLRDPRAAEVAFAVARRLPASRDRHAPARAARRAGGRGRGRAVRRGGAAREPAMLARVRATPASSVARAVDGGEVEVRFPIAPTAGYRARVDERDHVAVAASLGPSSQPRSVAVIGASTRRGSIGGELFRNVLAADFAGAAYPVNRSGDRSPACAATARSKRSRARRPRRHLRAGRPVLDAAEDALANGVRALCVISAGFAETGPRVPSARSELLALVRAHGARLHRPELPRHRRRPPSPERDLRAARAPARQDRLLVAERRARPGAAREGGGARARLVGVRVDRQQGRRLVERPARVVGGRRRDRVVLLYLESFGNPRKFARVARPRRAPQADPRDEGRDARGAGAGRRARTRLRSPARMPPSTRCSARPACCGRGRSRSSSTSRRCSRASRCRAGAAVARADQRRRARHPLRRRVRGRRAGAAGAHRGATRRRWRRSCRPRRASRTRSTCSVGRRPRLRGRAPAAPRRPGVDAVIVLFVPPVVAGAEEVGGGDRRAPPAASDKPVLASWSAPRAPRRACARAARRRRFRIPSRPRARSASLRSAPTGCGGRPARCRSSTESTASGRRRIVDDGARRRGDGWLDAGADARAARGVRHSARPRAARRRRRRGGRGRARSSGTPSSSRPRPPARTRRRTAASRSTSATRRQSVAAARADRRRR